MYISLLTSLSLKEVKTSLQHGAVVGVGWQMEKEGVESPSASVCLLFLVFAVTFHRQPYTALLTSEWTNKRVSQWIKSKDKRTGGQRIKRDKQIWRRMDDGQRDVGIEVGWMNKETNNLVGEWKKAKNSYLSFFYF